MQYRDILYEVGDDGVALITLNRPARLNAWTLRMAVELRDAVLSADANSSAGVLLLVGAGRGFCAGADMELLSGAADGGDGGDPRGGEPDPFKDWQPRRPELESSFSWITSIDKPVVCAINGVCAGLGAVIPLYCDVRLAAQSMRMSFMFSKRGLVAEHGVSWLLPRLVGMSLANDLLLSSRFIEAEEALRSGRVSQLLHDENFVASARAYAAGLATHVSPRSLRIMKRQLWDDQFQAFGPAVKISIEEMIESFSSEDMREGVAHFMEKREPHFSGR